MVSNKLSARRQTAAKPKICISVKPLPLIPPIVWPPTTFQLHLRARWFDPLGPHTFDQWLTFNHTNPPWEWRASYSSPTQTCSGWWILNQPASTGNLAFAIVDLISWCILQQTSVPVTWGIPSAYVVATWNVKIPAGAWGVARFTF